MTDRVTDPVPGAGRRSAGPDPLTLAAARDTGMPGFRIVATAPPESALPPIPPEELARRRHRDPWRVRIWWLACFWVALAISGGIIDRLQPAFRHGDLPPTEWVAWFAIQVVIGFAIFGVIGELIPRAFQRAKIRRMRAEATRSGGR